MKHKKMKQERMKQNKISWKSSVILVVAAVIFLYAAVNLGMIIVEYYKGQQEYAKLEKLTAFSSAGKSDAETPEDNPVDFAGLKEINPDIVSWIRFEQLDISYPVVQGKDNEFYLGHGFDKEKLKSGCIFMEKENKPDFSDDNTFIYGHNMKDKSMFAKLNRFTEEEVFLNNKEFFIETETGTYRYEIYSCYTAKTDSDSFLYQFADKEQYEEWQKTVKERSLYDTKVVPNPDQKTVTLMTCTSQGDEYRFLVHGVLMEE